MKKLMVLLAFMATTVHAGIDVTFIVDESGSMGGDQADVKANANSIFAGLPAGSHAAVIGYGNNAVNPRLVQAMTPDSGAYCLITLKCCLTLFKAWCNFYRLGSN